MKKSITLIIVLTSLTFFASAQIYNEDDKEGLRAFLRQPAFQIGSTNFQRLGLWYQDTINWLTDEGWINKMSGSLTWNQETPKRLIKINWSVLYLAGNLDCRKWTALIYLYCPHSFIKTIDLSNNPVLEYLNLSEHDLKTLDVSNCTILEYLDCSSSTPSFSWQPKFGKLKNLNLNNCISLKELRCYTNELTDLDISSNISLEYLDCKENQLTTLNTDNNIALKHLNCHSNLITNLNLSNNTLLTLLYCVENQLTELDLANNIALVSLFCAINQITTLDLSNNPNLDYLNFFYNRVTSLNISNCPLLTYLRCDANMLTELDASNNMRLKYLYCHDNCLTSLQVNDHSIFIEFFCVYNRLLFSSLPKGTYGHHYYSYVYSPQFDMSKVMLYTESLDLSSEYSIERNGNTAITDFQWYDDLNTPITSGITNNNGVFTFGQELAGKKLTCKMTNSNFNELSIKYTVILKPNESDNYFHEDDKEGLRVFLRQDRNFYILWGVYSDTINWYINEEWVLPLVGIEWTNEIKDNRIISVYWDGAYLSGDLEAGKWSSLKSLNCGHNFFTSLDVSNCTDLVHLEITDLPLLITLNISNYKSITGFSTTSSTLKYLYAKNCPNLKTLSCSNEQLITLDVRDSKALTNLYCQNNQLSTLNIENCNALINLDCNSNNLTTLDINSSTILSYLNCSKNQFKSLDLSNFSTLTSLNCSENLITDLNINNCTSLLTLQCNSNLLKTLDINSCSALKNLDCSENQLNELEVKNNKALETLNCNSNLLSTIDTRNNSTLRSLFCNKNQIKTLKINENLQTLHCHTNQLLFSEIPVKTSSLSVLYSPQNTIDGGFVYYKTGIDLTKEYNFNGNITQFLWFDITDGEEVPLELSGDFGNFILTEEFIEKRLRCKMTNATFPNLSSNNVLIYEITVSRTVDIDEDNISENKILIYPNPTTGEIRISYIENRTSHIASRIFQIEILTPNPSPIWRGAGGESIDISHLPPGIYFLKISTENGVEVKKVIKQ